MKKVKALFINTMILSATSLVLRSVGIGVNVYISNLLGPSGMGVLTLLMSIYGLSITFSISGIRLAATRLSAEYNATNKAAIYQIVRNCLIYSLFFSTLTGVLLYYNADFIGRNWLMDERTILALRLIPLCLPFIAAGNVLAGFFTGLQKIGRLSVVSIFEEMVDIPVTILCLKKMAPMGLEYGCAAIIIGNIAARAASFLLLYLLYIMERRKNYSYNHKGLLKPMFKIALPVAFTSYISSGIRSLNNILIPIGFKKSGSSSEEALSNFGIIQGMVMPVFLFPSFFLNAVSELLIPELASSNAQNFKNRINYIINRIMKMGLLFSIFIMSVFFFYSPELSYALYKNFTIAKFMRMLAPLIPVFYLDSITDGILKGIGEEIHIMFCNITESIVGVLLTLTLLPPFALWGYVFILYFTRALNFYLSVRRLSKRAVIKLNFYDILNSLLCVGASFCATNLIFYAYDFSAFSLAVKIAVSAIFYYIFLRLVSLIENEDVRWFAGIFR